MPVSDSIESVAQRGAGAGSPPPSKSATVYTWQIEGCNYLWFSYMNKCGNWCIKSRKRRLPLTGCSWADVPRPRREFPSPLNRALPGRWSPVRTTSAGRETSRSRLSSCETPCCHRESRLPRTKTRALCTPKKLSHITMHPLNPQRVTEAVRHRICEASAYWKWICIAYCHEVMKSPLICYFHRQCGRTLSIN